MELLLLFIPVILLGDSRKYPYPTSGGMKILTPSPPVCLQKFQNALPPCPRNSKIVTPSPFILLSVVIGSLVSLIIHSHSLLFPLDPPMPSEFQLYIPPCLWFSSLKNPPPACGILKSCLWYRYRYFLGSPIDQKGGKIECNKCKQQVVL